MPKGSDINALAASPDGVHLLAGTSGGELRLWNVSEQSEVVTWDEWSEIEDVAWLPDGRHVVLVGSLAWCEYGLAVWDTAAGKAVASVPSEARVYVCAVAPDGLGVAFGDGDGRVEFLRIHS